jgi:hypothetical protein
VPSKKKCCSSHRGSVGFFLGWFISAVTNSRSVSCRDALDAVKGRDGSRYFGDRMRVEVAKGTAGPPPAPRDWRDKGTGYRIIVEGLPRHASWQDLKVCRM